MEVFLFCCVFKASTDIECVLRWMVVCNKGGACSWDLGCTIDNRNVKHLNGIWNYSGE